MSSIYDWSTTEASNASADAGINWQEGQPPSSVNNSARYMMRRGKELLNDLGGVVASGGTANVVTLTASSPFAAYIDGLRVSFKASATNTGAATLNVNAIGAKSIRKATTSGERALDGYEIVSGGIYELVYNAALNSAAGGWMLLNPGNKAAWETIFDGTVSAAAAYNFTDLGGYRELEISGYLVPASDTQVFMRTSTNNGSSYDSGASDYSNMNYGVNSLAASVLNYTDTSVIYLSVNVPVESTSSVGLQFQARTFNWNRAALSVWQGNVTFQRETGGLIGTTLNAWRANTVARNALTIFSGGGVIMAGYLCIRGKRG